MWETKPITVSTIEGPMEIEARCRGQLAVHPMLRERGHCISLASAGLRMSWRWRVFATEEAAIAVADEMLATGRDWSLFFAEPRPSDLLSDFCGIHERAEISGAFEWDVIAPAGVIPPGETRIVVR